MKILCWLENYFKLHVLKSINLLLQKDYDVRLWFITLSHSIYFPLFLRNNSNAIQFILRKQEVLEIQKSSPTFWNQVVKYFILNINSSRYIIYLLTFLVDLAHSNKLDSVLLVRCQLLRNISSCWKQPLAMLMFADFIIILRQN